MSNMRFWNNVKKPPSSALTPIRGGRLSGKSDINPQWRYEAMTEMFGPCGIGWRFEVARAWTEPAPEQQVFAFAEVRVYVKVSGEWSEPIPGFGGSMLVEKESKGLYVNDEGYKMAITDALGTAMKMLGVAADVYMGKWDGTKYRDNITSGPPTSKTTSVQPLNMASISLAITATKSVPELNAIYTTYKTMIDASPVGEKDGIMLAFAAQKAHLLADKDPVGCTKDPTACKYSVFADTPSGLKPVCKVITGTPTCKYE